MTENSEDILDANEKQLLSAMGLAEEAPVAQELQNYVARAGKPLPAGEKIASEQDIVEALKTVSDPEIMVNVYDMGLVYKIDIDKDNGNVHIDMTVTAPTCPVAGVLPQQAADAVSLVEGTGEVEVKIVWEPAWTPERMSDEAKMMFELF